MFGTAATTLGAGVDFIASVGYALRLQRYLDTEALVDRVFWSVAGPHSDLRLAKKNEALRHTRRALAGLRLQRADEEALRAFCALGIARVKPSVAPTRPKVLL